MKKIVLSVSIISSALSIAYMALAVSYANERILNCILYVLCSCLWAFNAVTYFKLYIKGKKDEKEISFYVRSVNEKTNTVLYVCDGKACESCSKDFCNYTIDIEHAKNFRRVITTEDAVRYEEDDTYTPVIRCKDCKYFGEIGCAIQIVDESDKPKENDFCSFAERKEETNDER